MPGSWDPTGYGAFWQQPHCPHVSGGRAVAHRSGELENLTAR